ncbi:MAG: HlyD family efflux transporter periplasmic adaptor subunit [Pseudomonadota bacterium]
MRFLRRSLIGIFLLSATAGLIALAGNIVYDALQTRWAAESRDRPARERVFTVNVMPITPATLEPTLSAFGEIRSRRTLELRAASGGEVVWVAEAFEEGGEVAAGDLLVQIDPRTAEANRDTAAADLNEAEADLRDAERVLVLSVDEEAAAAQQFRLRERALTRQRDLLERGVGTEAAVETAELAASSAQQALLSRRQAVAQAEARIDQARTTVERREIALSEAQRRVTDTEVSAAFPGVLSDVSVVEGRIVSNNERLAELVDPTALEVSFRVSTRQYARLLDETGRLPAIDVTVSLDILGIDLEATGQITRESAVVSDGQTGRLLFARIEGGAGFRPGDFVAVRLIEPPLENVALLPAGAVDAAETVLVLGEGDRLEVASVDLLRRQGNAVIVRARGLAGREVVTERTPLLGEGIRVRPLRPDAPEAAEEPDLVELDDERRARLVAFVQSNNRMPADAKQRILAQLSQSRVPARMVARIESRMGG